MAKIYKVKVDRQSYEVEVEFLSETGSSIPVQAVAPTPVATPTSSAPTATPVPSGNGMPINAPMQGNIWKILKKAGESVKSGETILILEAMKMENNIVAPKDGIVSTILVKEGDSVDSGAVLAELS